MSTLRISMDIQEFVSKYKNHPVLFVGTGFSLRYLEHSYSWDNLLAHISNELTDNPEFYYDLKANAEQNGEYRYDILASALETEFNERLSKDRDGKFKAINDSFYDKMKVGIKTSRFKIYISSLLENIELKENVSNEIDALVKTRKNIGSIITTNYDQLIEKIFEFSPLIGNNILLSNPYGSVYKIHGCTSDYNNIIMTENDYINFNNKYELIRAQLLSLFIHNPIIFIGYSISDTNIKQLLKTVFSYVDLNTELAKNIRDNFLLVEYSAGETSTEIVEHDIDIEGMSIIRINKIKTDNYSAVYNAISNLVLPVSAMDIRKVQKVWNTIKSGGEIKVKITENLDTLKNEEMVIAVGSEKTIQYMYQTKSEMMENYFKIIDESNQQLIELLNKQKIQTSQFFPIFAFSEICSALENVIEYKEQQIRKLTEHYIKTDEKRNCENHHKIIEDILDDVSIPNSKKSDCIFHSYYCNKIVDNQIKNYLLNYGDKTSTDYRRLLCLYDYKTYGV